MMNGWRRAFCTSIPREREEETRCSPENEQKKRTTSRFGFFSNPSTPRSQTRPVSSPRLFCRSSAATAVATPSPSLPNSPQLHCRTTSSATPSTPKRNASPSSLLSFSSNPSSPKSPTTFSCLKAKLGFHNSSSRCGICLQSVKAGQGLAIFTAECSHAFHSPCAATRAASMPPKLAAACPVCGAAWREASLLSPASLSLHDGNNNSPKPGSKPESRIQKSNSKTLRVYDDDEPLISSPIALSRFNPIIETEESDDVESEQDNGEFRGFSVNTPSPFKAKLTGLTARNVEVKLLPEAAVVASGRGYETYSVVMKVKAPPVPAGLGWAAHRPPVDLVTVLDVSASITGVKLQMMKLAMRLVISSLREADRLSIVVFSSSSKRITPLRRMTSKGKRSARSIVDALAAAAAGEGMSVTDALKKAAKVIEDRRQRNVFASIIVLMDRPDPAQIIESNGNRCPLIVSTTRFSHVEIPVHTVSFGLTCASINHALPEDAFAKCIGGLLSVSVQNLSLQLGSAEIVSIYSLSGRPVWLGSGSGSVKLGDLYVEEERELLVELKAAASSSSSRRHHTMGVRYSYVDPTTQDLIHSGEYALPIPRPHVVRSPNTRIARLRNLHVSVRAVAESRRLIERNDLSGAHHLLTSARSLLVKWDSSSGDTCLRGLEAEIAEVSRLRERHVANKSHENGYGQRVDEKVDPPLTPTSAWRAAERLAKVARLRKHMNRVSDLHGFENARF